MTGKKECEEKIFWLDKYEGGTQGGIFWRGFDLVRFIERVETELGKKVVAIKIEPDSDNKEKFSANIEFITERRDEVL